VGSQGRSGRAENLVPTGIRPRTFQPRSSVAIPTELPGPHAVQVLALNPHRNISRNICIVHTVRVHKKKKITRNCTQYYRTWEFLPFVHVEF